MSLGKILKIDDNVDGFEWDGLKHWTGYRVETTKGTYLVVISDYLSCCESYGREYHIDDGSEDLSYFIGVELMAVLTDGTPHEFKYDESPEAAAMFVDFKTTKGVFTLTCYNVHNGYYAHHAGVYFRAAGAKHEKELHCEGL